MKLSAHVVAVTIALGGLAVQMHRLSGLLCYLLATVLLTRHAE